MDKIRWGIIGCGNVTEVKSGPAFQKAEGSELVAVMCRDGEKAKDYVQLPMVQHVTNCLLGKETPLSTGITGSRANRVMDEVLSSYYKNYLLKYESNRR